MHCRRRWIFVSLIAALLLPGIAAAQTMAGATPIIFERTDIRIDPAPIGGGANEATLLRDPVTYNIELRSEDALRLENIHSLNTLTDNTGVMILFSAPVIAPLPALQVYTPVDALFLAEDGTILQMLPNVTLGSMTQDIIAKEPVKAFLFLKSGQIATKLLQPRDTVTGTMFTPAPPVME